MAFDFKKEYKEFYMPKNKPEIVNVPKANYIAVRGMGNPNEEGGAYQQAISVLYAVAYTLKMSYKTDYNIDGFFEYVVPPLEGFWWQEGVDGIDYSDKSTFCWISVIRLPDFITKKDFDWAVETAAKKKKLDYSKAELLTIDEGLCVQIMHSGPYDDEPATVDIMNRYIEENGYESDFSDSRLHHEIYLSDARKVASEKWKTVIRHPIKRRFQFASEGRKMFIETERLTITEFTIDMAKAVRENSLDEDNRRFVPDEVWETVEEAEETLAFLISQYGSFEGPLVYPVIVKETNDNVGYVQLCPIEDGQWEVGYHIAKRFTGHGYATEAVKAFLPVIAKEANISEIYGICLTENLASRAVMNKCGFENVFNGTGLYQGEERQIIRNVWKA